MTFKRDSRFGKKKVLDVQFQCFYQIFRLAYEGIRLVTNLHIHPNHFKIIEILETKILLRMK